MIKLKMIKNLFLIGIAILGMNIFAQAQTAKMKSLINEIKAEFPGRQKEIAEKCGGASVIMDVDFASFDDNFDALQRVPQQGLKNVTYGFRRFCTDSSVSTKQDEAKVEAVKTKVKRILLKEVANAENRKVSLLKDGTVLIEMAFHDPSGGFSDVNIQKQLNDIL